jgi:hypothetical protein
MDLKELESGVNPKDTLVLPVKENSFDRLRKEGIQPTEKTAYAY